MTANTVINIRFSSTDIRNYDKAIAASTTLGWAFRVVVIEAAAWHTGALGTQCCLCFWWQLPMSMHPWRELLMAQLGGSLPTAGWTKVLALECNLTQPQLFHSDLQFRNILQTYMQNLFTVSLASVFRGKSTLHITSLWSTHPQELVLCGGEMADCLAWARNRPGAFY